MASETFKKRQKETARKEKKMHKLARRQERKSEKGTIDDLMAKGDIPELAGFVRPQDPTID